MRVYRPRFEPPNPPTADSPEQVAEIFKRFEDAWVSEPFFEMLRGQARRHCRNVYRAVYKWTKLPLKRMVTVYQCGSVAVKITIIKLVGVDAPRYVYIESVEVKRQ